MAGTRRHRKSGSTRKAGKGKWLDHVMSTYKSMKKSRPSTKLGDAMKAAKKSYRK
jgi:hypothetical protein